MNRIALMVLRNFFFVPGAYAKLCRYAKHPENYPTLIVRMCGFSAKFTSLSPEWQQEVLTRNFYE